MGVAQHRVIGYHPSLFTRGSIFYSSWTKGGPAGVMYAVSDSGRMEKENYESCFMKMCLPATSHLRESAPVVLFFEGHHSLISISLI